MNYLVCLCVCQLVGLSVLDVCQPACLFFSKIITSTFAASKSNLSPSMFVKIDRMVLDLKTEDSVSDQHYNYTESPCQHNPIQRILVGWF